MKIEPNGKEEINDFYNQTKGGVDSHDHKCSLYTTTRKTNRWPMRIFYGIIDSTLVNAFVIMKKMTQVLQEIEMMRECFF